MGLTEKLLGLEDEAKIKNLMDNLKNSTPKDMPLKTYLDLKLTKFRKKPEWDFLYYILHNKPGELMGMLHSYAFVYGEDARIKMLDELREVYVLGELYHKVEINHKPIRNYLIESAKS